MIQKPLVSACCLLLFLLCPFFITSLSAQVNAAFVVDTIQGCAPFTVTCTSTANDGVSSWTWRSSDGQTTQGETVTFTYLRPGKYRIWLVTSDFSSSDSVYRDVYSRGIPPDIRYEAGNVCSLPINTQFYSYDTSAAGVRYHWDFGDSTVDIRQNPAHQYDSQGRYRVQLITYSPEGCVDSATQILETGKVVVDFTSPAQSCARSVVEFTPTTTSLATSGVWTINDRVVSTSTDPLSFEFPAAGTYTVTLREDFGGDNCIFEKEKQITILPRPEAAFQITGTLQTCVLPDTLQFTNQSTEADTYAWTFGDETESTEANPTHIYTKAGQFRPQLIATTAAGCSDTAIQENPILLGPPQVTSISGIPASQCLPYTLQPQANVASGEPVVSYSWDFGDGSTATGANPSHEYTVQGYYDLTVMVGTASGCADTFTVSKAVSVGDSLTIDFTADQVSACGSDTFSFTGSASSDVTSWSWQFEDGGTASGQTVSHVFTGTGQQDVTLTVNNTGCRSRLTKPDFINVKPPIAGIQANYDCESQLNVQFEDRSQGADRWEWDFGDGTTSAEASPFHVYPESNTYTVSLTAYFDGCQSTTTTTVPVLNATPEFRFDDPADGIICRKSGIWMSSTYPEYIADYYWRFGDGKSAFSDSSIYNYYATAGQYYPSLIMRLKNGCYDTIYSPTPVVVTGPTAKFTTGAAAYCAQDAVLFTDASTSDGTHDIVTWEWTYGDGSADTLTAPPFGHVYSASGNYPVQLIIRDNNRGCTDTARATVVVNALPLVSAGADTINCAGGAVPLTASGAVSYLWGADATLSCLDCASPLAAPLQDAVYTVTGTDANSCRNSDTVAVRVIYPFTLAVEPTATQICPGETTLLTASGADFYNWSPQAGLSNAVVGNTYASPVQTTNYLLTATDSSGCFTQTQTVIVTVNPAPRIDITDTLITAAKGDVISLATTASPDVVSWTWLPASGLSCADCPQPQATAVDDILYTAMAANAYGCRDTDQVKIHVLCNADQIYLPKAFTPNGDNRNDWFYVMSSVQIPVRSFLIYDRLGQRVFARTNIRSNTPAQGWDGMLPGKKGTSGATYVYQIQIECEGQPITLTGTVTVVR